MSVGIGIIGLPGSGRTTIFNALTHGKAATGGFGGGAANIGIAKVPDERLGVLTDIFRPKKTVPAEIKYLDLGASVKALASEKGGGALLAQLATVDAVLSVICAFHDPVVPHPAGSIDVARDISEIDLELAFSDLAIIERRFDRIGSSLKGAKADERPKLERERELLFRIRGELEKDIAIREQCLSDEEQKIIAGYQFLSAKPVITLVNIGEGDLPRAPDMETELNNRFAKPNHCVVVMCGKLEAELAALDDALVNEFLSEYSLPQTGLARVIQASYGLLGLISFLTVGEDEVRAWPIGRGMVAQKAAGKVHSDIERGFIRAEVVSYQEMIASGSLAEARKRGTLRLEGKAYVVQDGDIINYLFNV
jgi:GTP-binding protein YchF